MFELSSHLDLSEGLVHAANILLLISFSLKSMLMLRALNILAGGCFILYFAQLSEPLWASVAWNVLFGVGRSCGLAYNYVRQTFHYVAHTGLH